MKRGQAAVEYMLITALVLIIFIPAILLFLYNIRVSNEELALSKLNKIGNDIISAAIRVYYQGEPAKTTLKETFPEGLINITIMKDWSLNPPINQLVFVVKRKGKPDEMVFNSEVNIAGDFTNTSYEGIKTIILRAENNGTPYVNITIK